MGLTVNRKIAKMGLWVAGSLGLWVSGSLGLSVSRSLGLSVSGSPGLRVSGSPGLRVSGSPGLGSPGLWIELPGLCLLLGLCVSFRVILPNSSAFHANYLHEILPFEKEHAMDTITVTFISLPL